MIPSMIIAVLVLALAGLAVLHHAIKSASTGYEDGFGFHEGHEMQTACDFATAMHAAIIEQVSELPDSSVRTSRVMKRAVRKVLDQGTPIPHTT